MKKFLSCFAALVFFFLIPSHAFAHFPKTDGDMTVILHVDPNDDPVPGQQAHLYFLFDDTTKRFALVQCICNISITEEGKQTYSQKLSTIKSNTPSIWGASMPYIFPERNVYQIVLTGRPQKTNEFQPFTLSWYFRVDTVNPGLVQAPQEGLSDSEILFGALGVLIIALILFGLFLKKEFARE